MTGYRASRLARRCAAGLGALVIPFALLALAGCTEEKLSLGERCQRNSECPAPLVCRIGYCRKECNTTRDCAAGLSCVRDAQGLGACQLPPESSCTRDSDCREPLVCRLRECVNECVANVDCPAGARCLEDETTGLRGCVDMAEQACVRASECADFEGREQVCAVDGRCRDECRGHRDCRFGTACCVREKVCRASCPEDGDAGLDAGPTPPPPPADAGGDTGARPSDCVPGPLADPAVAVTVSQESACARLASGSVWCWGAALEGQLGTGATEGIQHPPRPIVGVSDVIDVSRDLDRVALAVRADGSLVTWGRQPLVPVAVLPEPTPPGGMAGLVNDAESVALGGFAFCFVRRGSGAFCYGNGNGGLLGFAAPMSLVTEDPMPVDGAADAVELSLGTTVGCLRRADGRVACWGRMGIGSGAWETGSQTPVELAGITDARDVTAGDFGGCVLSATGAVSCWGLVASDAFPPPATPTPVLPAGAVQIATGGAVTCAVLDTGGVTCWGAGALGDGAPAGGWRTPFAVVGVTDAVQVDVGNGAACVVRTDGRVSCWGANRTGVLGDCTIEDRLTPGDVLGLP